MACSGPGRTRPTGGCSAVLWPCPSGSRTTRCAGWTAGAPPARRLPASAACTGKPPSPVVRAGLSFAAPARHARHISEGQVRAALRTGSVNQRKSDLKILPCPKLVVDAYVPDKNLQVRSKAAEREYSLALVRKPAYALSATLAGAPGGIFSLSAPHRRRYSHRQGYKLGVLLSMMPHVRALAQSCSRCIHSRC